MLDEAREGASVHRLHLGPEASHVDSGLHGVEVGEVGRHRVLEDGDGEVGLVVEVVVEGALAQVGVLEDAIERRRLIALRRQLPAGAAEQARTQVGVGGVESGTGHVRDL